MANATSLLGIGGRGRGGPRVPDMLGISRGRQTVRIPTRGRVGKPIPPGWQQTHPAAPGTAPGAASGAPGGPYADSTALANIGTNTYNVNQQVGGIQLRDAQAAVALQQALAKLAYQQPRDALSLEQNANRGGGLYSSVESLNQGNLAHRYLDANTSAQTGYSNQMQGDAARIAGLQGGIPIYNAGQYAAAAQRGSLAAQKDPSSGEPISSGTPTGRLAQSIVGTQGPAKGLSKGQPGHLKAIPRGPRRGGPRVRSYL